MLFNNIALGNLLFWGAVGPGVCSESGLGVGCGVDVSLTSRTMYSLASREVMLSRLPEEARVRSRSSAWVERGLPPPRSWYRSTLSGSKDQSGNARVGDKKTSCQNSKETFRNRTM